LCTSSEGPKSVQKNYAQQKQRQSWKKDEKLKNWIIFGSDLLKVECKYCRCTLQAKHSTLLHHCTTAKHKANAAPFSSVSNSQPELTFKTDASKDQLKIYEGRTALYIAVHSAILPVSHLVGCMKESFKKVDIAQDAHLGRTKCSMIIKNVWGAHFKRELINDIGDSFFSLLIDESTDISVTKFLGLVIIYYSLKQKQVVSTYLSLEILVKCDAESIAQSVKSVLQRFGLSIQRLRGLGTDNASVMVGINNGVFQLLKRENPNIVLIPCICHSLQLAVTEASKDQLPRVIEYIIQETYNWFSRSSQRQAAYKEVFHVINEGHDPLKIVRACKTRWLSIESAVTRIVQQFEELKLHFGFVRLEENCYTAETLYSLYSDHTVHAYLIFLKITLREVQAVNKMFESNSTNHLKVLDDLWFCITSLTKKICNVQSGMDPITMNIEDNLIPQPYLGYEFENFVLQHRPFLKDGVENMVRSRCVSFLKKLLEQLRNRLPANIEILRKISTLSPTNATRQIKPTLIQLLEEFGYSDDVVGRIQQQWENLHLRKWHSVNNIRDFWTEILDFR